MTMACLFVDVLRLYARWQSHHRSYCRLAYAHSYLRIRGLARLWLFSGKDSLVLIDFFCEQIATMKFILERTSIPVPKILAYELDQSHPLGAHMLLEKV